MKKTTNWIHLYIFLCIIFWVFGHSFVALANALFDYVKKDDSSYSWKVESTIQKKDYTAFIVRMNSQTWRTAAEVSSPLWQHTLTIVRPKDVRSTQGLLFIGNGTSKEDLPTEPDPKWVQMALRSGSTIAELRNVPNQPLIYLNDGQERYEDNSVAYSWDKVMTSGDLEWSIRFPMVKSVVRAMDTVQAIVNPTQADSRKLKKFVVAGVSKRGWSAWLTAAVDRRVSAIIPMAIDVLNVREFLKNHYSVYGFWTPAIKDYDHHRILDRFQTPEFKKLLDVEDPYSYRAQLKLPKYLIHASGDQFFPPNSSQFYFHDLLGQKFLRYIPNADHSMKDSDAFECLESFYSSIIHKAPLPQISWVKKKDGSLEVKTLEKPEIVKLWSATNPNARDFRLEIIGRAFAAKTLEDQGNGTYLAKIKSPEHGFSAFFVELTFSKDRSLPLKLTTEVSIVPDRLP
jgi:PhoPQ-activated pathogenicity-related protein